MLSGIFIELMSQSYDASMINVIDLSTKTLSDIIFEIEARPLMWLPEKHIMYFATFLDGHLQTTSNRESQFMINGFDRFIDKKYNISTTHGWARNLNYMSANPHDALDKFFEEFKIYLDKE